MTVRGTSGIGSPALQSARARALLDACHAHHAFEVVSVRAQLTGERLDLIDVDAINHGVPSRSELIRKREPITLEIPADDSQPPRVVPRRNDFPLVNHLNWAPEGQPWSLCLYFEPWPHVRRHWTPQKFLGRILWWFEGTARDTLHRPDQPLEPLYFEGSAQLVLPGDFEFASSLPTLGLAHVGGTDAQPVLRAFDPAKQPNVYPLTTVPVTLAPLTHRAPAQPAHRLGRLHDELAALGAPLDEALRAAVKSFFSETERDRNSAVLLLLRIPMIRTAGGPVERYHLRAFLLATTLADLGERLGVVKRTGSFFGSIMPHDLTLTTWREVAVDRLSVRFALTREQARRMTGVAEAGSDAPCVIAGVGALGSALAEIWTRESWGIWTFIDEDRVQPHNLVRHLARDLDIGSSKVDVVAGYLGATYAAGTSSPKAIASNVLAEEEAVTAALKNAKMIVDATTSLEVPRQLSRRPDVGRVASVFLAPSGRGAALLLEDESRSLRIDAIEAQYYRALVREHWGAEHLAGHAGELFVGAGCRDASLVLSPEQVSLWAGVLSHAVRVRGTAVEGSVEVWRANDDLGVAHHRVETHPTKEVAAAGWTIVSDQGFEKALSAMRHDKLPSETGGILIGYADHVSKRLYVVDALAPPADSIAEPSEFIRGSEGAPDQLKEVGRRTANIVGYVGEWHSHPAFHSATPSSTDRQLISTLAAQAAEDGEPVLMVIVGSGGEVTYTLKDDSVGGRAP